MGGGVEAVFRTEVLQCNFAVPGELLVKYPYHRPGLLLGVFK